ncbi:hypothetical protein EBB07_00010 [Paenibacillaceae bacterium]|nr:hypothetical protein EBB07_00010 [Paenibacillaceae bacterium]
MRRFKKRLQKKYYSRVATGLQDGSITPFYANRARIIYGRLIDRKYVTEFRPWWYDQFDRWSELSLTEEQNKFFDECRTVFEQLSGIDYDKFKDYIKQLPERNRKPRQRKEKPDPPVRKLRKPERFRIRMNKDGIVEVAGEKVFSVEGYDFFIHRSGGYWSVSDATCGARLYSDERYKKAVKRAYEIIEKNFDNYVDLVSKRRLPEKEAK